jgi:hypothetical protein
MLIRLNRLQEFLRAPVNLVSPPSNPAVRVPTIASAASIRTWMPFRRLSAWRMSVGSGRHGAETIF